MMNKKDFLQWIEFQHQLKNAKQNELTLRKKLCNDMFRSNKLIIMLPEFNYEFQAKRSFNYTVNEDVLETIWSTLTEIERNVIKFKPSVKEGGYKKLSSTMTIHEAITKKPGVPTLTLKVVENDN